MAYTLRDELVDSGEFSVGEATRLILRGNVTVCKTRRFIDRVWITNPKHPVENGDWIHVTRKNHFLRHIGKRFKYLTSSRQWIVKDLTKVGVENDC